ncbi:MAG: hypothetical protein HY287_04025 [Planctomycetes bacterium]|nr:hypothetical protein [Planctomycetota bacterium]MBI3833481.1 hypothetical protein [Planctomycetota bacterium]
MDHETHKPIQTFREGAIGVSIWKRTGRNGSFYDFTLSRSYKKSDTEAGYALNFHEDNERALVAVIGQAASFIRDQGEKETKRAA